MSTFVGGAVGESGGDKGEYELKGSYALGLQNNSPVGEVTSKQRSEEIEKKLSPEATPPEWLQGLLDSLPKQRETVYTTSLRYEFCAPSKTRDMQAYKLFQDKGTMLPHLPDLNRLSLKECIAKRRKQREGAFKTSLHMDIIDKETKELVGITGFYSIELNSKKVESAETGKTQRKVDFGIGETEKYKDLMFKSFKFKHEDIGLSKGAAKRGGKHLDGIEVVTDKEFEALLSQEDIIGMKTSLKNVVTLSPLIIAKQFQRSNIATEAFRAILFLALKTLNCGTVTCQTKIENIPMISFLEKRGMTRMGSHMSKQGQEWLGFCGIIKDFLPTDVEMACFHHTYDGVFQQATS